MAETPCDCHGGSRLGLLVLLAVFGVFLIACAALAVAAGLMLMSLGGPGVLAVLPVPLLIAVGVLLMAVFIMLALLLWCCCGKKGPVQLPDLGKLLPTLRDAAQGMETAAAGLDSAAAALRAVRAKVNLTAEQLGVGAEKLNVAIPTVTAEFGEFALGPLEARTRLVTGLKIGSVHPLAEAKDKMTQARAALDGPGGVSPSIETAAAACNSAARGLRAVRQVMGLIGA